MSESATFGDFVLGNDETRKSPTGHLGPSLRRSDFVVELVAASVAVVATLGIFAAMQPVRGEKEPIMKSGGQIDTDLVTLPSAHSVTDTIARLKAVLAQKGIDVFAHIDHAAGAKQVGLPLRPTQLLIFGNPKGGTPLMQARQTIGLDLPLRALVWEDEEGKAWLTYSRVQDLARRHHITDNDHAVKALDDGLVGLVRAATTE
jgi:uncharacterized protein (DUF302 family)